MENKAKILGQYFSGNIIPRILFCLLNPQKQSSIIDPMAGIGDMLIPFVGSYNCEGIEIDVEAYNLLKTRITNSYCDNSFAISSLKHYNQRGYDIVITNPPYIRRELQIESIKFPNYVSIDDVKRNLCQFAINSKIYSHEEINKFITLINSISGLSDIAVPSWILCMLLTKPQGKMAMVVPNSWLTREYAKPVMSLFCELFDVQYIINDKSSLFFKGKALVKTCLIVAVRKNSVPHENIITVVDLYKKYLLNNPEPAKICEDILSNHISDNSIVINNYSQGNFSRKFDKCSSLIDETSSLYQFINNPEGICSIAQYGISFSQGFRSGANGFFYFTRNGDSVENDQGASLPYNIIQEYLQPAIRTQCDVRNMLSVSQTDKYVLTITDSCLERDLQFATNLKILPAVLSSYILESETTPIKGKLVPKMSAVRSNVRIDSSRQNSRFWYMLPEMKHRHQSEFFFPRVNGQKVVTCYNDRRFIIDANFLTASLLHDSPMTLYSAFALLNSTWTAILFEERGTVMGGGALKLDAVQLLNIPYPVFTEKDLNKLHILGEQLVHLSVSSSKTIISRIDQVFIKCLSPDSNVKSVSSQLELILSDILNKRNG